VWVPSGRWGLGGRLTDGDPIGLGRLPPSHTEAALANPGTTSTMARVAIAQIAQIAARVAKLLRKSESAASGTDRAARGGGSLSLDMSTRGRLNVGRLARHRLSGTATHGRFRSPSAQSVEMIGGRHAHLSHRLAGRQRRWLEALRILDQGRAK
jgi:hypothetical protein